MGIGARGLKGNLGKRGLPNGCCKIKTTPPSSLSSLSICVRLVVLHIGTWGWRRRLCLEGGFFPGAAAAVVDLVAKVGEEGGLAKSAGIRCTGAARARDASEGV